QAEDGIRDRNVTGVQTCALPISDTLSVSFKAQCIGQQFDIKLTESLVQQILLKGLLQIVVKIFQPPVDVFVDELQQLARSQRVEIGRASCRERAEISVVAG